MNNFKAFLMFSTVLSLSLTVALSNTCNAKTVWLNEDDFRIQAEGDGDYEPTNINLTDEEVSLQAKEMKKAAENPQKETIDDAKLPTLTSEGSFLLPTHVLPEAQKPTTSTVASVDEKNPWRKEQTTTTTRTHRTIVKKPISADTVTLKGIDTPATLSDTTAEGAKEAQLLASIEKQYQDTTALLEATSKRLAALEVGIDNLSQKADAAQKETTGITIPATSGTITVTKVEETPRAPLLLPLAPIRTATVASSEETDEKIAKGPVKPARMEYADYVLSVIRRNASSKSNFSESDELILRSIPKEMKISFLPDTADLSNQAFKWIKIFAFNPTRNISNAVEIRLSPDNLDLQSRRFSLIKGVLLANGLSPRQVRFVFTDRNPDTVILRNITLQDEVEYITQTQKNGKVSQQIIQKW